MTLLISICLGKHLLVSPVKSQMFGTIPFIKRMELELSEMAHLSNIQTGKLVNSIIMHKEMKPQSWTLLAKKWIDGMHPFILKTELEQMLMELFYNGQTGNLQQLLQQLAYIKEDMLKKHQFLMCLEKKSTNGMLLFTSKTEQEQMLMALF